MWTQTGAWTTTAGTEVVPPLMHTLVLVPNPRFSHGCPRPHLYCSANCRAARHSKFLKTRRRKLPSPPQTITNPSTASFPIIHQPRAICCSNRRNILIVLSLYSITSMQKTVPCYCNYKLTVASNHEAISASITQFLEVDTI